MTVTEVQRARIRAIAAHLWQTQDRFDILDGCRCIIGHAVCLPEMNLAGLEGSFPVFTVDGVPATFSTIAAWFGLAGMEHEYFAADVNAMVSLEINSLGRVERRYHLEPAERGVPWFHCTHDAKGAAIMLLTAIGEMGPPEPVRERIEPKAEEVTA